MATIRGSRGVAILFFMAVIALFSWFIYFLVVGNTDPAYYWRQAYNRQPTSNQANAPPAAAAEARLLLQRNKAQTIGKLKITYLGKADRHLLFDVHILDLDPNFAYRYIIPLAQAKAGFPITDQYFQAHATSNNRISLTQLPLN
jgi:hypothetical protein